MRKFFDFYRSGQFNGKGPVLYIFRVWTMFENGETRFGQCQCVEEDKVSENVTAYRNLGYEDGWHA